MLRACALNFGGCEMNNNYQISIKMTPFEVLYGRMCSSSIWYEGKTEFEPNYIKEQKVIDVFRKIKDSSC
jgi:hypothetical protein